MKEADLIEVEHRYHGRHKGQQSSIYRFTGLIKEATGHARAALKERAEAKAKREARLNRKNPRSSPDIKVAEGTMPSEE